MGRAECQVCLGYARYYPPSQLRFDQGDVVVSKVVVVGAGNWGKNLVRNFYDLEVLAGVAELNLELRSRVEETYPDIPTYENFRSGSRK